MKETDTFHYPRKARTEERTNVGKESLMRAFTNSLPIFDMSACACLLAYPSEREYSD